MDTVKEKRLKARSKKQIVNIEVRNKNTSGRKSKLNVSNLSRVITSRLMKRRKIVSNPASPMLYYLRQKPKTCGTVDIDVLAASIQKNCAMTKGDVKHVIEALVEEIQGNLANGDKVKLNQLGTFHMTFRCPGMEASDKCTVRNISKVNIRFIPDKELKLVNGSTAVTRSPANVGFVLDKPEEGGSGGGNQGGGSGGGSGDDGDQGENPLG